MSKATSFHVRHDLQPILTFELLTLIQAAPVVQTQDSLRQAAETHGYKLRARKDYGKLIKSLIELGVLTLSAGQIELTSIGTTIVRIVAFQQDLLGDFIHFLYYVSYDSDSTKRFSWSYQVVCNILWQTAPCSVNRDRLVSIVTQQSTQVFEVNSISFSTSSVAGILNWLGELKPSCLSSRDGGEDFIQRRYCTPELFMLALNHVYLRLRPDGTLSIPISPELRDAVCQICLITQDAFPEMLSLVATSFPCVQVRYERGDRLAIHDFDWYMLES